MYNPVIVRAGILRARVDSAVLKHLAQHRQSLVRIQCVFELTRKCPALVGHMLELPNELRRAIQDNPENCVLLVGAGLSMGKVRSGGRGLPDWDGLIREMIKELRQTSKCDSGALKAMEHSLNTENPESAARAYQTVAGVYKDKTRGDQFAGFMQEKFDPRDILQSELHRAIIECNFRGIITTNYDMVFEEQRPNRLQPLIYPQSLDDLYSFGKRGFLFKAHGCIRYTANLQKNLILSGKDYERLRGSKNYELILKSILAVNPILSVGYSLRDPDFLGIVEDLQRVFPSSTPTIYALMRAPKVDYRDRLRKERGIELIPYERHEELLPFFSRLQSLLPPHGSVRIREIAEETREALTAGQPMGANMTETPNSERSFLDAAAGQSLKLGGLDLCCKLLPVELWSLHRKEKDLYVDDPEASRRVLIEPRGIELPDHLLGSLVTEIEQRLADFVDGKIYLPESEVSSLQEVQRRLKAGSNAYPRLAGAPEFVGVTKSSESGSLLIPVGPSRYGVALVEEKRLNLPTATALRSRHILNSLAVRVALIYEAKGKRLCEFHQRKGGENSTYKDAWDVAAAGYVDPQRHRDPEDHNRISPWQACAWELSEELGIPSYVLPYRDNYYFFGLGRNDPTGQLDLLAYCSAASPPDPERAPTPRVTAFDRCLLDPVSVSAFLFSKRKWVPTAVLTMILTLEAYDYPREEIERAFLPLVGKLDFRP